MAGTTRVDWKLTLTEEGAKRFPLLYFFIVLTLPVVFKREIGQGRRGAGLYRKEMEEGRVGGMCIREKGSYTKREIGKGEGEGST